MDSTIVTGIFTLGGAFVGSLIPLIKDIFNSRMQLRLEKVRLHSKEWLEAHKRLFVFARRLANRTFPMVEDKRHAFIELIQNEYMGKIQYDYVYFSPNIAETLDELESRYICMTDQDLIPEMDSDDEKDFLENKLFDIAERLQSGIKETVSQGSNEFF